MACGGSELPKDASAPCGLAPAGGSLWLAGFCGVLSGFRSGSSLTGIELQPSEHLTNLNPLGMRVRHLCYGKQFAP